MMTEAISRYYATPARRAALLTCAATGAFFAALLGVMFYLRWVAESWPSPFHFASLLMVTSLTMFGLAASTTFEIGSRAVGLPDIEPAIRWIAVGIATWLTFQFLEIVEWIRLVYLVQLGPDTAFGSTFLALTAPRRRDILAPVIFSHFLNVVWIVLVATLYLPNSDLWGLS